jgi:GrpB-like predicted nucleotidyltransferase (UPF0157 family)
VITDYDPSWPTTFQTLRVSLESILGGLALGIEHVGSTSVPGLPAKPIIDLDVVVRGRSEAASAIERLTSAGYTHLGDLGVSGREAFESPEGSPEHHLYVCQMDSRELRRHIAFRDYLRLHPDVAEEYGKLKQSLARKFREDREAYTEAKTAFVEQTLKDAGWTE